MADATAAWLDKLQRQPWFQKVSDAFAAQKIATPLWEATLLNENAALNPSQATYDPDGAGTPGTSYGLFQERQPGVGSGHSIVELTDPVSNATIAAAKMRAKLDALGISPSADLASQLRGIEQAGWNGSLAQDGTRQAQLSSVLAAGGTTTSTTSSSSTPTARSRRTASGRPPPNDPLQWDLMKWIMTGDGTTQVGQQAQPTPDVIARAQTGIQDVVLQLTIGAVFLALIAGGFAILAGGVNSSPRIIPV